MNSINDLKHDENMGPGICPYDIRELARIAWHPVSEPPTQEDGWFDHVMFYDPETNELTATTVDSIECGDIQTGYWARICDVVLFPEK